MILTKAHLPALLERLESAIEVRNENQHDLTTNNYTSPEAKLLFEVDLVTDNNRIDFIKSLITSLV